MSDDLQTGIRPPAPVHFQHWCEEPGCSKWGGHGYDVGRGEMRWFCFDHKWNEYPNPRSNGLTTTGTPLR
jgi:hypothetical protein